MNKSTIIVILLIILFVVACVFLVRRADKICSKANPNNYANYRFCMGV